MISRGKGNTPLLELRMINTPAIENDQWHGIHVRCNCCRKRALLSSLFIFKERMNDAAISKMFPLRVSFVLAVIGKNCRSIIFKTGPLLSVGLAD